MTDAEYIENIDTVSTEQLFKNLDYYGYDSYYADLWNATISELKKRITPTGEWVLQTYERFNSGNELYKYYCNKCGHKEEHAYSDSKLPNFCPNCGAKMMKEAENERKN